MNDIALKYLDSKHDRSSFNMSSMLVGYEVGDTIIKDGIEWECFSAGIAFDTISFNGSYFVNYKFKKIGEVKKCIFI